MAVHQPMTIQDNPPRTGITTGSCAALAAAAAARMLLGGVPVASVFLTLPSGVPVAADVLRAVLTPDHASCAVRKDAGSDPDITHGVLVHAAVSRSAGSGVMIEGGEGIGRVTRPGLEQGVGEWAINSGPRRMIAGALAEVMDEFHYDGGLRVVVSIPGGEELARKTFNPKLGIEGGLSILGSNGVVEPMSTAAIVETIRLELRVLRAGHGGLVLLTPGRYGEAFIAGQASLSRLPAVTCSNFIGDAVDNAVRLGFAGVIVVGHLGKMVKLAGGIMHTHSRTADCRLDLLALHAGLAGGGSGLMRDVLAAATVDAGLLRLNADGLTGAVIAGLLERIDWHLAQRAGGAIPVGAVVFSPLLAEAGVSKTAARLLEIGKVNSSL